MSTGNEKQKILIVDDSEMNRSILADMLGDEYEIVEAVDGAEAVARLNMDSTDISLMLLDIVMPNMDGFEVLAVMNRRNWIQDIPVITRYPGGSMEEYERQTVPYLEKLSEEAFIMPGHGVPCNMGKLKYKERGVWDVALGQTSRQPLKQIAVSSGSG